MHDFSLVQQHYAQKLSRALELATERLPIDGLSLRPIDPAALHSFNDLWRYHEDRIPSWDWSDRGFRPPKGLNVGVWYGETLCGLASGKLTQSKAVRVDHLEGRPGSHPLKGNVIPIVLTCAEAYRILIGSNELRLHCVIEPLIPVYAQYGFELAPESERVHIMRRISK